MLTSPELALLEALVARERTAAGADRAGIYDDLAPGDVVQLCPGADPCWETSLLLVCQVTQSGRIRGPILRPHRSGCREAWAEYSAPELARIGRTPFPEPSRDVYCSSFTCPLGLRKPPGRAGADGLSVRQAIAFGRHRLL